MSDIQPVAFYLLSSLVSSSDNFTIGPEKALFLFGSLWALEGPFGCGPPGGWLYGP